MGFRALLTGGFFSTGFWRTFGHRLLNIFYRRHPGARYDFGFGYMDVRRVCKYHLEERTEIELRAIIQREGLQKETHTETAGAVMQWVNETYPSSMFYELDKGDRWNTPLETLESFRNRQAFRDEHKTLGITTVRARKEWRGELSTDCDDYAILLYNLCRLAGIPAERLYLAFMKTETEWHMNVMYFDEAWVPYALEGTYYPHLAMRRLGKVTYFDNETRLGGSKTRYYQYVRWLFNEEQVRYNPYLKTEA